MTPADDTPTLYEWAGGGPQMGLGRGSPLPPVSGYFAAPARSARGRLISRAVAARVVV